MPDPGGPARAGARAEAVRLLLLLVLIAAAAGAAAWHGGARVVAALIPATHWSLDRIDDRVGTTALSVEQGRSETVIRMRSRVVQPIVIGNDAVFPTGQDWFEISTPLFGMLVPFVLATSLAGAWPGSPARRLLRASLAGALSIAWLLVDLPLSLHGFAWGALRDSHAPGAFYPSILWLDFMHSGGRLAVGVLLAALACLALRPRGSPLPAVAARAGQAGCAAADPVAGHARGTGIARCAGCGRSPAPARPAAGTTPRRPGGHRRAQRRGRARPGGRPVPAGWTGAGASRCPGRTEGGEPCPPRGAGHRDAAGLPAAADDGAAAAQLGAGSTVVVIDTGIDYTRVEFGACSAPGIPAGCRVLAAFDTAADDGLRDDATRHGSRVGAAVLAAAPQARLVAIDAFTGATGFSSDVIEGIDWAIANREAFDIVAINLSLGGTGRFTAGCGAFNPFRIPIQAAWLAGIVTVASSGNSAWHDADGDSGTPPVFEQGIASPACVPFAVSVGAVYDGAIGSASFQSCSDSATSADQPVCFSQVAPMLTLLAPGAAIDLLGTSSFGTSFAAPFVAAAFALLRAARPSETASRALARLVDAGAPVPDARVGLTFPRLQVAAALDLPPNDLLALATPLSGSSGSASGSNTLATAEAGEPAHASVPATASLWWRWTAPATGNVTFDTIGSSFDTVLAAYTGSAAGSLAAVAADDDGGGAGTSVLTFQAATGTTYSLAVDGKAGSRGTIALGWQLSAFPVADLRVSMAPDPFQSMAGSAAPLSVTVSNAGPEPSSSVLLALSGTGTGALQGALPAGCSAAVGLVQCPVPALATGGSAQFLFSIVSGTAATLALTATLSGAIADPQPADNAAVLALVFAAAPNADVPLPGWALVLAAAGMLGAGLARRR